MKETTPLPTLDRHSRLEANTHKDAKGGEHTPDASQLVQRQLVHPQNRGKYFSPADANGWDVFAAFLKCVDV